MDTDLDRIRHESLNVLKPVCMSMMQDVSKTNVTTFITAFSRVRRDVAQEIQQYILFPLQSAMHQKNISETTFCDVCLALDCVLSKTVIQSTRMFMDIFNPVVLFLSSPTNPSKVSVTSEEAKVAAVNSLSNLFRSTVDSVLQEVYSLPFLPAVGQVISLLLSLSELERSRTLQISSMDCLELVMQIDTKFGSTREVHLGAYFAFCLPGITMAMGRIITGDQKQGSDVIRKAMGVWINAVCLVISNENIDKNKGRTTEKTDCKGDAKNDKLRSLMVDRNEDWVKTTASKLKILIGQISKLGSHSNWRVRLSLAELAEAVLLKCYKSLNDSVPKVLECLVALINDEYEVVATQAISGLKMFSESQVGLPGERSLTEMLEDNIYKLATSLPRQMRMCDEEEKMPLIKLLKGYIMLLGSNIRCIINSSGHLRHLALALVQSLEMDCSDGKILEERVISLDYEAETLMGKGDGVWKPKKYFKHFRDESISTALFSVCHLLGKYGNVYILVDCFLDLFHESCIYKLASILIINEIVYGAGKTDKIGSLFGIGESNGERVCDNKVNAIKEVIKMLLEEYVCTVNLDDTHSTKPQTNSSSASLLSALTISQHNHQEPSASTVTRNHEILLSCLFMEGVGKFALVMGEEFKVHLIQTLYPLVENLGHENTHISSCAYDTLTQICAACKYSSIDILIQANADYLINSVSLRLRHFNQNQRTPRLMCVMFKYCSHDLLPLVYHSIGEILDSLDDHYTEDVVLFMPVLLELTIAIGRWFPFAPQQYAKTTDEEQKKSIVSYLVEYVKLKRIAEMEMMDDDDTEGERSLQDIEQDLNNLKEKRDREEDATCDEEDEEKEKEVPQHVQVVKEVLARIKNLLSSRDARIRVQALEIVAQGCQDLVDHERELLPQLHKIWPSFYPRFHSEEKFVIIKALQTLRVMAEVSGNFVQQRVMKDIIPRLSQFMEKQAKISCNSSCVYVHTPSFKLQLAVLNTSGLLAEKLELKETNLDLMAKMCLPYLSGDQPLHLQTACVNTFHSFIHLDADAMWLALCRLYCPWEYKAPSPKFKPLPKSFYNLRDNSYSKNVTDLFQKFYPL